MVMNTKIKSLYRKHRPKQFSDVVGQEHVTKTLTNQILKDNVPHAYLFCGTRGTGKTSVAKIFAHAVNCLNFKDGKVCGTCAFCKSVAGGNLDVFEIDAASNNGVDAVRELVEKVKYPPVNSRYKVYIIDEVHMFSTAAFNALLKTLEEPPSHVIFVLATTEPHKLLPTVLSRCLRFDFRAASVSEISGVIKKVFKKEGIVASDMVVNDIATASNGSFRDGLSLAETVASYANGNITTEAVSQVLGTVDKKILEELFNAITMKDIKKIVDIVNKIFSVGRNVTAVINDFLEVIKNKFVEIGDKTAMSVYRVFSELGVNIKTATEAKSMFEGACLLCTTN